MRALGRLGAAMVVAVLLMPAAAGAQTARTRPAQAPAVADQWHVHGFTGRSMQYSSYSRTERLIGVGVWFDY